MTSVSEERFVQVDLADLERFKKALERARYYHPVNRQIWLQLAGLIERARKQQPAEKTHDVPSPPS